MLPIIQTKKVPVIVGSPNFIEVLVWKKIDGLTDKKETNVDWISSKRIINLAYISSLRPTTVKSYKYPHTTDQINNRFSKEVNGEKIFYSITDALITNETQVYEITTLVGVDLGFHLISFIEEPGK